MGDTERGVVSCQGCRLGYRAHRGLVQRHPIILVTVAVANPDVSLPAGSWATLEIVTGSAKRVVTVPVSAVSADGDTHTVRVLENGKLIVKTITVGIVGKTLAEVADGLETGAEVVLADLDEEVTGAGTDTGGRVTFGGPDGFEDSVIGGPGGTNVPPGVGTRPGR